jgi:hypothetical protein
VIIVFVEDGLQFDSLRALITHGNFLINIHQFYHVPIVFFSATKYSTRDEGRQEGKIQFEKSQFIIGRNYPAGFIVY